MSPLAKAGPGRRGQAVRKAPRGRKAARAVGRRPARGLKGLPPITKDLFVEPRDCSTWAWYRRRLRDPEPPGAADRFLMEQGRTIGLMARSIFPGGLLVAGPTPAEAASQTGRLLADASVKAIFEASFADGDCVARPDILIRQAGGWKVIEVKSSLADSPSLENHIDDVAFTSLVAGRAGLKVSAIALLLLSRKYRKGEPASQLFEERDVTAEARARHGAFARRITALRDQTTPARMPAPRLRSACVGCEYFRDHCIGRGSRFPVTELPGIARGIERLRGTIEIADLPGGVDLTSAQKRVARSVVAGAGQAEPSLGPALGKIEWPSFYLDFETVQTALPLYDGVAPYEPIVTQYSIDVCHGPGKPGVHREFLADPLRDDRRALAERLLQDLGERGSIVVYSTFEATQIRKLMARFPDLAGRFEAILRRLFDLLVVLREGYYHPDFHGSYSIKHVLPALVPGFRYDDLAIRDGASALACFAEAAMGRVSPKEWAQRRADLLTYCGRDTQAMVKVHERLMPLVAPPMPGKRP